MQSEIIYFACFAERGAPMNSELRIIIRILRIMVLFETHESVNISKNYGLKCISMLKNCRSFDESRRRLRDGNPEGEGHRNFKSTNSSC